MTLSPSTHDHAAHVMHDLASALSAGLSADAVAAAARLDESKDPGLQDVLAARGVNPTAMEQTLLAAFAESGQLVHGLRRLAGFREESAQRLRQLYKRLAYPLFLLVAVVALSIFLLTLGIGSSLTQALMICGVVVPLMALALGAWAIRSGLQNPEPWIMRVPFLATVFHDAGEWPYLASWSSLHGAGIDTIKAHARATETVPVEHIKQRLLRASTALLEGKPFAESLGASSALRTETIAVLAPAELAGELEDGTARAATRCRERLDRGLDRLVRHLATGLYWFAVLLVVATVVGFYSNYFAALRSF